MKDYTYIEYTPEKRGSNRFLHQKTLCLAKSVLCLAKLVSRAYSAKRRLRPSASKQRPIRTEKFMDKSAHAAVLTEPRNFEFRDFPIPEIAEHDGLLRVEAAGLCGTDYEQFGGHLKDTPWDIRPIIPGHEIQGWIEKIGCEASRRWRIKEGDRVVVEASIPCGKCYQCQNGRAVLCSSGMGYGLRISSSRPPHLWGGYATHMYLHP